MKYNLGYCCINMTLQKERKVTIGRGMIKRTFADKGIVYASELALANVKDMVEIIKWNHKNGITLYRMSSDMFPWCSEYELKDLPDYDKICNVLKGAGALAKQYGQRLTFHPGPFSVLASANPDVVTKTIRDLNTHGEIMDLIGLPRTPYAAINVHVNTTAPTKETAMARFCENFKCLDDSVKSRLVVENDDKLSQYDVKDLYHGIYSNIRIPITFDFHHYDCHPGEITKSNAFCLAKSTWHDVKQLCHFSSSKKIYEDASSIQRAHADYIYEEIPDFGLDFEADIEIEAKAKELAVLQYLKQYNTELV